MERLKRVPPLPMQSATASHSTSSAASTRPRVLLIAPSLTILGGQAVQAAHLLQEFAIEPRMLVDFQPINPCIPAGLKRIRYVRTVVALLIYCLQLFWRIPKYDVIHTFTAGMTSFCLWTVPSIYISRLYGKKIIINYRDGRIEQHLQRFPRARKHLQQATIIVSPSEYVVDVLARYGVSGGRRIFNIIDAENFHFRERSTIRPALLSNRSLERLYNVGCILRAFAIIQKKYPDATLTIVNDGPCRLELEALASELGLRNVSFVGAVPHQRILDYYDAADIYLTSPNLDCMPGSLLECFASGLPVVATKAGGIPYIVEHERTGLLVDLDDHEAMAACAIRLLQDPELVRRISRAAYEELQRYQGTTICAEWLDLYLELI
jgi:glycosyltransferase involved in cell wall biosynthesis